MGAEVPEVGQKHEKPAKESEVSSELQKLILELYLEAGAEKFGLGLEDFANVLGEVRAKYLPRDAGPAEVREFCKSLRVEELALARACLRGHEAAWEVFLTRYRQKLYEAAYSIAQDEASGRELADSLYGDLYGTETRDGRRVSKLNYYAGRGSLEGWLRAVLAQEHIDRRRAKRRLVSLEEQSESGAQFRAPDAPAGDPSAPACDPRLVDAIDEALTALPAEDKFILASYYLDSRRLAEIAKILGVHESTVSRKLEKITASLTKRIFQGLMRRGMTRRQAQEALEVDVRDVSFDARARLVEKAARNDR